MIATRQRTRGQIRQAGKDAPDKTSGPTDVKKKKSSKTSGTEITKPSTNSDDHSGVKRKTKHLTVEYNEGNLQKGTKNTEGSWMPDNWEAILNNIRKMREKKDAPVDTLGCEKCPDETAPPEHMRFQTLVSLMLSAQTKDEVTHAAVQRLISHGLTAEKISSTDVEVLEKIIYPVSFYRNKAKHIRKTSEILVEKYHGDIPDTVEDLCKLPGVGPKMAYLAMACAWNKTVGIGVDTHVHRICNRLNWVQKPTKEPEQTRKGLESWLPRDLWDEINWLLVGFGQTVCLPVKPKCSECLNNNICPFAKNSKSLKGSLK